MQSMNWDSNLNTSENEKKVTVNFDVPIHAGIPVDTIYEGETERYHYWSDK
jgi:hypothetical protein